MDNPYGASVEKLTFYHMPEFQMPTAPYQSKIGIKKWLCILWICLENNFELKKFEKIQLLFSKPKSSLAELWSPVTPNIQGNGY